MSLIARRWIIVTTVLLEVALCMLQVYVAAFAPESIIDSTPTLNHLTRQLEPYVPSLSGYRRVSRFPQVSVAFYVISTVLLPLQIVAFAIFNFVAGQLPGSPRLTLRLSLSMLAALALLTVSLFFLPEDYSLVGSLGPNSSRFGLAFFGVGQFLFLWCIAGMLLGESFIVLREVYARRQ